ncbi:MAG: RpiB/LacA/LacB family sugar-phosphate isomerase [Candidatus Taylorbacteria bacterium]|nr:RpiB/LacA/LacB family sugar-phosphate isomerase [Candidatus Taylorbacteria bacterium]
MKLLIAADHAGIELKNALVKHVQDAGHEIVDMSPTVTSPTDDYPIIMHPVAIEVARDPENIKAIIIGGSGTGEAIEANRHRGVRAAIYYGGNPEIVKLSREHNNANVLSLGARFLSKEDAVSAVSLWLATPFSGDERHVRRIKEIDTL